MIKKITVLSLSIILISFSVSIILKCAIGIGAWGAFSQTAAELVDVKIGTFSIFMNTLSVIAQTILRKEIKITHILQVFLAILLGVLINFFYYQLMGNWDIGPYFMRVIFYLIGTVSVAFAIGTVVAQDFITLPLSGLCMEVSKKINRPFGKIRQWADIITIAAVLVLVVLFDGIMTIREGTVIGMIIFGPLLDLYMRYVKPFMIKINVY